MLSTAICSSALAQVEEIVMTGSRFSGDEYSKIPAVVLLQRVDFLCSVIG
jgi:hypothetical protein